MPLCTTPLYMHNKCTFQATQCNLDQSILRPQQSVGFLELCVKLYRVKWTIWLKKLPQLVKEPMQQLVFPLVLTISFDHFFSRHGLRETDIHLHADNCAGQHKNNYFLWYLAWRIATEPHQSIKYSFLISGLLNLVWIIASESWKGPIRSVYNLWTCSNGGHIKQHRGEQSPARIDARWPCIISCIRLVYFSGIIFKKKSRTMHLRCDIQMRNNIKSKLSWLSVANHVGPWVNKLHLHFLC